MIALWLRVFLKNLSSERERETKMQIWEILRLEESIHPKSCLTSNYRKGSWCQKQDRNYPKQISSRSGTRRRWTIFPKWSLKNKRRLIYRGTAREVAGTIHPPTDIEFISHYSWDDLFEMDAVNFCLVNYSTRKCIYET